MAQQTYNNYVPDLGNLQTGDTVLYGDKLNMQSPDMQTLIGSGSVAPYLENGVAKGVTIVKPYIKPGTQYMPSASNSDFWSINPNSQANLATLQAGTYNLGGTNVGNSFKSSPTPIPTIYQNLPAIPGAYETLPIPNAIPGAYENFPMLGEGANPQPNPNIPGITKLPGTSPVNPYTSLYNQQQFTNQTPTGIEDYASKYQDLIKTQQQALESQYQSNISNITAQYGQAKQTTQDVGGRTMGTLSRILGRAGGFTTTAGGQAIAVKEGEIQNQINQLTIAENQAKMDAQGAKDTGNARLMENSYTNLYNIQKDIQNVQQQRANNLLDLMDRLQSWDKTQQATSLDQQQQAQSAYEFEQKQLQEQQQLQNKTLQEQKGISTDLDYKMLAKGYDYVSTPAERDRLKSMGYEIINMGGRTYAKEPETLKATGGGGGTKTGTQGKSQWTQIKANTLYEQYISAGYNEVEAANRVGELAGFMPKSGEWAIARQFIVDNPGADPNELKSYLQQNTSLTDSEITAILPKKLITNTDKTPLTNPFH